MSAVERGKCVAKDNGDVRNFDTRKQPTPRDLRGMTVLHIAVATRPEIEGVSQFICRAGRGS